MGTMQSSTIKRPTTPPIELSQFKGVPKLSEGCSVPEIPQKRVATDRACCVVFIILLLLLLPFMVYTINRSDLDRLTYGYDDCGNVCGKENPSIENLNCSGRDYKGKIYLQYEATRQSNGKIMYTSGKCSEYCILNEKVQKNKSENNEPLKIKKFPKKRSSNNENELTENKSEKSNVDNENRKDKEEEIVNNEIKASVEEKNDKNDDASHKVENNNNNNSEEKIPEPGDSITSNKTESVLWPSLNKNSKIHKEKWNLMKTVVNLNDMLKFNLSGRPKKVYLIEHRCFTNRLKGVTEINLSPSRVLHEILWMYTKEYSKYITLTVFIAFVLCWILFLLFRYVTVVAVWLVLLGSVASVIALTVLLWIRWALVEEVDQDLHRTTGVIVNTVAIIFTVITVLVIIMTLAIFRRINLVTGLMQESLTALYANPSLLFLSILTFLLVSLLAYLKVYFHFLYYTAGNLKLIQDDIHKYMPNELIFFTRWHHLAVTLLIIFFFVGCQDMIIAGSVSALYFTRNKASVNAPVKNSFICLLRYHLGTVAFGSMVNFLFKYIRFFMEILNKSDYMTALMGQFLYFMIKILKYFSKYGFIITAMHGKPLYESGQRAMTLLHSNVFDVFILSGAVDFIIFSAKLFISIASMLIIYAMKDDGTPIFMVIMILCGVFTSFLTHCIFSTFETAVDTILLCICEDTHANDGDSNPYFMTPNLMKFVDDSRTVLEPLKTVTYEKIVEPQKYTQQQYPQYQEQQEQYPLQENPYAKNATYTEQEMGY